MARHGEGNMQLPGGGDSPLLYVYERSTSHFQKLGGAGAQRAGFMRITQTSVNDAKSHFRGVSDEEIYL